MKLLYAIQGTGNGHLSRAMEIAHYLTKYAEVDFLLSGKASELPFPYPFKYKYHGLFFIFGNRGGPNYFESIKNFKPIRLLKDILSCPVKEYDYIINDFEPISSWAAFRKKIPCIGVSHHSSFYSKLVPRPSKYNYFLEMGLAKFAPNTKRIGIHYKSYDKDIYPPIIRKELIDAKVTDEGHITIYLPAFSDKLLIEHFRKIKNYIWKIFSKKTDHFYTKDNVEVYPINIEKYSKALLSAHAVILAAGFQATSEAIFLKKKMLVIPMKNQYEQKCNAAALSQMGIKCIKRIDGGFSNMLLDWLINEPGIFIDMNVDNEKIAKRIIELIEE